MRCTCVKCYLDFTLNICEIIGFMNYSEDFPPHPNLCKKWEICKISDEEHRLRELLT